MHAGYNFPLMSGSVTTTKWVGWRLKPLGAHRAASSSWSRRSGGTGSGRKWRVERRARTRSRNDSRPGSSVPLAALWLSLMSFPAPPLQPLPGDHLDVKQCQHHLEHDEHDDNNFHELGAVAVGLVRQHLVHPLGRLQLALDVALPLPQVEARRQQPVDAGQVLIADQL